MGHLHFRKLIKKETVFIEKKVPKHNHEFKTHCILEVTCLTGSISYYNVKKCTKCNSFESISEEGNIQGAILRPLKKSEIKLPIITADYNRKNYLPVFSELTNITFCKPDKRK